MSISKIKPTDPGVGRRAWRWFVYRSDTPSHLLGLSFAAFMLVAGPMFAAVSWISATTTSSMNTPRRLVEENFILLQFAVPVIGGLLAVIIFLTLALAEGSTDREGGEKVALIPLDAVEKLRWDEVSESDRDRYFQSFLELSPKAGAALELVAPPEWQLSTDQRAPIPLHLLQPIMEAFDQPQVALTFPLLQTDLERLHTHWNGLLENIRSRSTYKVTATLRAALLEMYDYLCCGELQPSAADRRDINATLVFAARWSMRHRVDEAVKQAKISGADIVLLGGRPGYDDSQQPPVAESEFMEHYLRVRDFDWSVPVHLETRSKSSREALLLAEPLLTAIALKAQEPLQLGVITSSFHMRRIALQVARFYSDRPFFDRMWSLTVPAAVDLYELVRSKEPLTGRSLVILETSISEYIKLIGGRATGEF